MICYFCKQDTPIDEGLTKSWKLDCLHCLEINKNVTCAFSVYNREGDFVTFSNPAPILGEWKIGLAKIYFHMPTRPKDIFVWEFNLNINQTRVYRIGDADTGIKQIYIFNSIVDVNLSNIELKTKTTLLFS